MAAQHVKCFQYVGEIAFEESLLAIYLNSGVKIWLIVPNIVMGRKKYKYILFQNWQCLLWLRAIRTDLLALFLHQYNGNNIYLFTTECP